MTRHPFLEIADDIEAALRVDRYQRQHPERFGGDPGLTDEQVVRLRYERDRLRDLARDDEDWYAEQMEASR
jgi:hypothetical protein